MIEPCLVSHIPNQLRRPDLGQRSGMSPESAAYPHPHDMTCWCVNQTIHTPAISAAEALPTARTLCRKVESRAAVTTVAATTMTNATTNAAITTISAGGCGAPS
jgi:hypothetical protein